MKILIVGLFEFKYYEEEFGEALSELGHEVIFHKVQLRNNLSGKTEYHLSLAGPITYYENNKVVKRAIKLNPDIILFWRGTYILTSTLQKLKNNLIHTKLVSYNNDDPFGSLYLQGNIHQKKLWKRFISTIPLYDINFVYRAHNIEEYNNHGSKRTEIMLPGFKKSNVEDLTLSKEFDQDVVFIGHQEEYRVEVINYLLDHGIDVRVYGNWNVKDLSPNYKYGTTTPIFGKEYFRAINRSKIALCFFSRLNRDEYTRRTFEIPAAYGCMCSEETESMLKMFEKDKESIYFRDKEECLSIIQDIIHNHIHRNSIVLNGNSKIYQINAEINQRADRWLIDISHIQGQ